MRNRRARDVRGDRGRGEHLALTRPDSGVEGTSILIPPSVQNHERRSCQTTTRIARTLNETTNPKFQSSTNVCMTCGPGWRGPGGARRRVSGPRGFKARAVTARGRQVHATVRRAVVHGESSHARFIRRIDCVSEGLPQDIDHAHSREPGGEPTLLAAQSRARCFGDIAHRMGRARNGAPRGGTTCGSCPDGCRLPGSAASPRTLVPDRWKRRLE